MKFSQIRTPAGTEKYYSGAPGKSHESLLLPCWPLKRRILWHVTSSHDFLWYLLWWNIRYLDDKGVLVHHLRKTVFFRHFFLGTCCLVKKMPDKQTMSTDYQDLTHRIIKQAGAKIIHRIKHSAFFSNSLYFWNKSSPTSTLTFTTFWEKTSCSHNRNFPLCFYSCIFHFF